MQASGIAHRKIDESFIVYDGENQKAVMDFLKPLESHITKKKNKIQVITQNGATSIEAGQVVVKGYQDRIEIFSQPDFLETYEIQGE